MFLTLSNEIEDALKRLTALNGKMSDCLNNENTIQSSGTVHTLQVIIQINLNKQLNAIFSNLLNSTASSRYFKRLLA